MTAAPPTRTQPGTAERIGDWLAFLFVLTWIPAFFWLLSVVDAALIVGGRP